MRNKTARKYPNITDIQKQITAEGTAHLTFQATEITDIIHAYSLPGYEYLSYGFVEFLDRFKPIIPRKVPIVLEVTGKEFNDTEKGIIDRAIWQHYGLYLSEAASTLKKTRIKMVIYFILMILSSAFLFGVDNISNEVIVNYGYLLFWFFGYRLLILLILNCIPIYREYYWYRRLAALKLIFSDESIQELDALQLTRETSRYTHEADRLIQKHHFVNRVFMDGSSVSLGCRIENVEDILSPSGAKDIEVLTEEMADYLMSALPFIRQDAFTSFEIEGGNLSEENQARIVNAIRNHMAFIISQQDDDRKHNKNTIILFATCLLVSTSILYAWGHSVSLAVHEFILVNFWFFGDYLLEFIFLSTMSIKHTKKTLEKLANMDITFKN